MEVKTDRFRAVAARTMADETLQKALENVYSGFHQKRVEAGAATEGWEEQRDRGRAIKAHTIANLDYYLDMLTRNVVAKGGNVFFAA
ncbi:MAG: (Fe-S)-binding protein, partial [Chloroflexi bacterium]|nr:(Fe-S)-binding protein [Chloroflexota bacterium]